ncbi:MAG: M2 family metallopeptidase, partial [Myxococcales bacterium]|nr:M2 family metallopeptidase [Myxococcales bacterium]
MKRRIASFLVLAAACSGPKNSSTGGSAADSKPGELKPSPAEEAKQFVARVDEEVRRLLVASSQAEWAKQTDITPEHEAAAAKAGDELNRYTTKTIKESRKFDAVIDQLDADTRRKLHLIQIGGTPAPDDPKEAAELAALTTEMDAIYGKSKVCDAAGKNCKDLGDLETVLAKSRKPAEQLAAWQGWHDTTGRAERDKFVRFVGLA